MSKLSRDIVAEHSDISTITKKKVEQIVKYYVNFISKNDNHINFFGGNLIGVYPIKFLPEDTLEIVEEIAEIPDYLDLKEKIISLPELDSKNRVIASNPVRHVLTWLIYKCMTSDLDYKIKMKGAESALNLLQIISLTSIDSNAFKKFRANEATSQAAYESLDKKSLIKRLGSWQKVIEYRSERLLEPSGVFYDVVTKMDDNYRVVEFANGIHNRVKNSYVTNNRTFHNTYSKQMLVSTSKVYTNIDGKKLMIEYEKDIDRLVNDSLAMITKRNDLIKEDLVYLTLSLVTTATEANLNKALEFIIDNVGGKKRYDFSEDIEIFISYIFDYVKQNSIEIDNIPIIVERLRSMYRSHKANDERIITVKKKMDEVVKRSIGGRHAATKSATKVAVLVYLTLRILTIKHYN